LSLLVGSAAAVVAVHSRRASHSLVWRTDAAAGAEGAHASLADVWREFRERGEPPGMRNGRRARRRDVTAVDLFPPPAPAAAVAREYASLALADGVVEFRRYPEPPCPVPI
jgi:hypothetical protein